MIKPEYINIPDTEFVPLTENEVGEYFAGLYEINKKGEVRNVKTKRTLKIVNSNSYPRLVLSLKKTYKSVRKQLYTKTIRHIALQYLH